MFISLLPIECVYLCFLVDDVDSSVDEEISKPGRKTERKKCSFIGHEAVDSDKRGSGEYIYTR